LKITIQIFGTKKCSDTRKAERFFKERGINPHFVDLADKGISKGELNNIAQNRNLEELINTEGATYKKMNLKYMVYDVEQIILDNPTLLVTPIVRNGKKSTIGINADVWKQWLS